MKKQELQNCNKDWFEDWFDSPYYHLLYKHRDSNDAKLFIDKIVTQLNLKPNIHVADIACGKGRHAIVLNQKGFKVCGTDLSPNSIAYAKKFENETLKFEVQDMRIALNKKFDVIFNLFTSFGYFKSLDENIKVLKAFKEMMQPNGYFIIDFLNAQKVIQELIPNEKTTVSNIQFNINRTLEDQNIVKTISFTDQQKEYKYKEKVQLFTVTDFEQMCQMCDLKITHYFGDYLLNSFNPKKSDRLIIIGQHKITNNGS